METFTQFLGRFHPLLVHLPIGFLLLAFIFECLSVSDRYKKINAAVRPSLQLGAVFAIASCITGYFLKQEGGYDESLVNLHQNFGIATASFAVLLSFFRKRVKVMYTDRVKRKKIRILLFVPLVILLGLTGHWGGSITHGEAYLSLSPITETSTADPAVKINAIANYDTAVLYQHVIQPLLEARCYACHSSKKQKGQLRLDNPDFIKRGGKNGKIIVSNIPDSSKIYSRLLLPLEDKKHMPPHEKPQLSSTDIALIQVWVEEGARFDKTVADYKNPNKIVSYLKSYQKTAELDWVPKEKIGEPNKESMDALKASGVLVMPLSGSTNYLMVNFINLRSLNEQILKELNTMKDHIVWLNLGFSTVSEEQIKQISELKNLRALYLNNSDVTDKGISHLTNLKALMYLNLVSTSVTDSSLEYFKKMDKLKNVYLYQTKITSEALSRFQEQFKDITVDTGAYKLEVLPTDTIIHKRKI